jgi:hypothetical protein
VYIFCIFCVLALLQVFAAPAAPSPPFSYRWSRSSATPTPFSRIATLQKNCTFLYFPLPSLQTARISLSPPYPLSLQYLSQLVPSLLAPVPCSLFPIPYSLFPRSLFPIPCSLVPYSLFPIPCSLVPCSPFIRHCAMFKVLGVCT